MSKKRPTEDEDDSRPTKRAKIKDDDDDIPWDATAEDIKHIPQLAEAYKRYEEYLIPFLIGADNKQGVKRR